ncbi:Flp pilus assembly protein CpaB [Roseospirillum parvum]|uniref:Pilus assembly protein CpaB n=1 Tax=Roseospirillum parvum TaxID=83401 RepID=A0A1G8C034_9PROT|nr:Flp pilus assembly protein CpaB [Roseospirillum parvum]SDH38673.1 pilus assembly protein CpaB [Roseospirillum parvum]
MRPLTIILLVAALAIAGAAAFLVNSLISSQETQEEAGPAIPTVDVLVANDELSVGAMIRDDDLAWAPWPEDALDSRLVVRTSGKDPKAVFVGAFTRKELIPGEPLRPAYVFRQGDARVMAGLLTPGMRGMAISISAESSVAGFIRPGDHVDVVLTYRVQTVKGTGEKQVHENASETLLRDIRVLAIDQAVRGGEDVAKTGKTATLEVTLPQAEVLALAQDLGNISLVLRSLAPGPRDKDPSGPSFTSDLMVARGLAQAVLGRAWGEASGSGRDRQPTPVVRQPTISAPPPPTISSPPPPPRASAPPPPPSSTNNAASGAGASPAPPAVVNIYRGGSRSQKAF